MRVINLILLIISTSISIYSQSAISGKITDQNLIPLPGVNIIIDGSNGGTITNDDGYYIITGIKPGEYEIRFSHIGYKKEIKKLNISDSNTTINIILQEEAIESGQVIVAAGKYEQSLNELPVSASIMPAEVISRKNFYNLEDVMRYIPGVNMTDDQMSIRGSSGYGRGAGTRVLMAIDGLPFYTGDTGEIIWESIPVTDIERVEVIKGASSSLYGSGAIGGVINIITKKISDKPQTYIKTFFGGYDRPKYDEWDWAGENRFFNGQIISHSNSINNFNFTASLTRLEDEGYKQSTFFHRYLGYFKGIYNFSSTSSLNLFFNSMNQWNGNFIYWKDSRNALIPPDADQGQRIRSWRYMAAADYRNVVNSDLSLNFKIGYYKTHWEDQTTSANTSTVNLYRSEVQSTLSLNSFAILVSGIEASYSDVNSNLFGKPDAAAFGIYSQADFRLPYNLLVTAGLRFDYTKLDSLEAFSDFSPKLGLNYTLTDNVILRASAGAGFRAPSLAEAFTSTQSSGITVKPNPNLKPESSISVEAGIKWEISDYLNIDAALFQNEFYDYIEPGVDSDGKIIFNNVVRARIQGYELSSFINIIDNLNIDLNYTYLWARDIEKEKALKYRPRHIFSSGFNYKFLTFDIGADFRYMSKVEEIDDELITLGLVPDGEVRDEVIVLDLTAGYRVSLVNIPFRLSITANNILNYYYVELIGNVAPVRNVTLGAEFVF